MSDFNHLDSFFLLFLFESGSEKDVNELTDFFRKELDYQVEYRSDMTKSELQHCFNDIESQYLTEKSTDYHSFVCIVMSHGNKVSHLLLFKYLYPYVSMFIFVDPPALTKYTTAYHFKRKKTWMLHYVYIHDII